MIFDHLCKEKCQAWDLPNWAANNITHTDILKPNLIIRKPQVFSYKKDACVLSWNQVLAVGSCNFIIGNNIHSETVGHEKFVQPLIYGPLIWEKSKVITIPELLMKTAYTTLWNQLTCTPISVFTNQTGNSPKNRHPFMAKLLTRDRISLKCTKFTTGNP